MTFLGRKTLPAPTRGNQRLVQHDPGSVIFCCQLFYLVAGECVREQAEKEVLGGRKPSLPRSTKVILHFILNANGLGSKKVWRSIQRTNIFSKQIPKEFYTTYIHVVYLTHKLSTFPSKLFPVWNNGCWVGSPVVKVLKVQEDEPLQEHLT